MEINSKINPSKVQLAINCGGESLKSSNGITYVADSYYSGGQTSGFARGEEIKHTNDQEVYYTERWSKEDLTYTIPIKGEGSFVLILQFSEVYFSSKGEKVFDVEVNGIKVLESFDIFEKVGKNAAYDEFIKISVSGRKLKVNDKPTDFDGNNLDIKLVKKEKDNPKINGIVLVKGTFDDTHYKEFMDSLEFQEKMKLEKERKSREFQRMSKSIDYEDFEDDFVDDGRFNLRGNGLFSFKGFAFFGVVAFMLYFLFSL